MKNPCWLYVCLSGSEPCSVHTPNFTLISCSMSSFFHLINCMCVFMTDRMECWSVAVLQSQWRPDVCCVLLGKQVRTCAMCSRSSKKNMDDVFLSDFDDLNRPNTTLKYAGHNCCIIVLICLCSPGSPSGSDWYLATPWPVEHNRQIKSICPSQQTWNGTQD